MKKAAYAALLALCLSLFLPGVLTAEKNDDLQAIKKAVKKNPGYKPGTEVRWFKLLVRDSDTNKDRVKITLPISVIEIFMKCTKDRHLRIDCDDHDIDLKELFRELKKHGPTSLIEVQHEDEIIKVWLE